MKQHFQIAVDFGCDLSNNLGTFRRYLNSLGKEPYSLNCPPLVAKGDYDKTTHDFRLVNSKEDAEILAQRIRDTGLVKEVHIQEW